MRKALQWRLLLTFVLLMLVPTLVVWLPLSALLGGVLDFSPRAGEIARHFDALAFEDIGVALARDGAAVGGAATLAALLALLLAPLYSGMVLTVARHDGAPLGFVALLTGGIAWYGRMFRVALVSLVPLALIGGVASLAFHLAGHRAETAILESQAAVASLLAWVVVALFGLVVHATVEAARAQLVIDESLRSGWRAWIRALKRTARQPLPVLTRYLVPTALGFAVAALLLLVRVRTPFVLFAVAFLITQLAVAALGWARAARLIALVGVRRSG
jgi:hypothetical protein